MNFRLPKLLSKLQNDQLEELIFDFALKISNEVTQINSDNEEDFDLQIEELFQITKNNIKQMKFEPLQ